MAKSPAPKQPPSYLSRVKAKLKTHRDRLRARVSEIVAKPPSKKASRLSFTLYWNGHQDLSVDVGTADDVGNGVSSSRPYGRLIAFDAPPGEGNRREEFRDEKPKIVQAVIDELVSAWRAAKGANFPLRAAVDINDASEVRAATSDVDPNTKVFDLKSKRWVPDAVNLNRGKLNSELRALIRPRLKQLQPDLVLRLQKITRARVPDGAEKLIFELHDVTTAFDVQLFAPDTNFSRTIFSNETLPDGGAIDWTHFANSGADVWHAMKDELILLLAEAWREAGGDDYPIPAMACEHDGGGEYDLKQRRWVTDFLGREVVA